MNKKKWVSLGIGAVAVVCVVTIGWSFFSASQANRTAKLVTELLNETPKSVTMYDGYRMTIDAKPEQIDEIMKSLKSVKLGEKVEYQMIAGGSFVFECKFSDKTLSYGFTSDGDKPWVNLSIDNQEPLATPSEIKAEGNKPTVDFPKNSQDNPTCYSVSASDYEKINQLIQQLVTDAQS